MPHNTVITINGHVRLLTGRVSLRQASERAVLPVRRGELASTSSSCAVGVDDGAVEIAGDWVRDGIALWCSLGGVWCGVCWGGEGRVLGHPGGWGGGTKQYEEVDIGMDETKRAVGSRNGRVTPGDHVGAHAHVREQISEA